MKPLETIKIKEKQKDIEKGQKIVAAIYLVTKHLSDKEPIRQKLREMAVSFVCAEPQEAKSHLKNIETLLGGASFAGLISSKNSSVIVYEMKHFAERDLEAFEEGILSNIFNQEQEEKSNQKDILQTSKSIAIERLNKLPIVNNANNKSIRQESILSFINDRKSAVIKDITTLFSGVSEKTIQRELNALIDSGKITKRGNKRWSIYMAVNSLL